MAKYVVLFKFTEQGIKGIREHPARRKQSNERLKAMGVTGDLYLTMGPYDGVGIYEARDDETLAKAILYLGSRGNVSTLTMKAFTEDEGDRIISGLPA